MWLHRIKAAVALCGLAGLLQAGGSGQTFLKGADISLLQAIEDRGGTYKQDGRAKDALAIFKDHGCNAMRLRLFHAPTGKPPLVNDLSYTTRLGRRIKAAGMQLLLDFHYSDTWADPGKQITPLAWRNLGFEQLKETLYRYTCATIGQMRSAGSIPDIVQVGNEITPGMLWDSGRVGGKEFDTPDQWRRFAALLKAAIRGVHDGANGESIKTMVHIACGGDAQRSRSFFDHLLKEGVDFDIIGFSYYPWWHSNGRGLEPLRENLDATIRRFGKDVVVVETAYPWKQNCEDPTKILHRNQLRPLVPGLPPSPESQRVFLEKLLQAVRDAPKGRGKGVFYWAPEYIPTGELDPGRNHLSLFDQEGRVLPGMRAFLPGPKE